MWSFCKTEVTGITAAHFLQFKTTHFDWCAMVSYTQLLKNFSEPEEDLVCVRSYNREKLASWT